MLIELILETILSSLDEQQRIVTYLDGLPPIGGLRQAKVNALREFALTPTLIIPEGGSRGERGYAIRAG